jgi:hypothetical protein
MGGTMSNKAANNSMEKLPKLKISGLGWDDKKLHDLDEARFFAFTEDLIVTLEGQIVGSFEEIEHLTKSRNYREKEYLEIVFLPVIVGGE